MWTCRHCGLEIMFRATQPEIDEIGCYFLCLGCGHRNNLINKAEAGDESIVLGQPDE